jgi:hypothetical protein
MKIDTSPFILSPVEAERKSVLLDGLQRRIMK